ncbi:MAG: NUDIX domain-containing protein [Meiothermus sp.]|nr:NUDIX domain-containing protein [Meiothermus sp.]
MSRRRAFCYVTRPGPQGLELLVFRQDDPAAGVQTPGGTIEDGEGVLEGAVREAAEESGLQEFGTPRQIGFHRFDHLEGSVDGFHVHLPFWGEAPEVWTHTVSAGADDAGMQFHCFWLGLLEARAQVWPHMELSLAELEP